MQFFSSERRLQEIFFFKITHPHPHLMSRVKWSAPNTPFMKKGKCYVIDKCLASYHARDKVHIILCTRYRTFASAGYNIYSENKKKKKGT